MTERIYLRVTPADDETREVYADVVPELWAEDICKDISPCWRVEVVEIDDDFLVKEPKHD